jgi:hypothetical protein
MSLCYLLFMTIPPMQEETFGFEHQQAHRQLWASMAPLVRFSVLPYILYPDPNNYGDWHLDHEQATRDAAVTLPGTFGGIGFLNLENGRIPPGYRFPDIPEPQTGTISSLNPVFDIQDYDLDIESQREWWTFQNHYWHLDAQSILNSETFVYPFF